MKTPASTSKINSAVAQTTQHSIIAEIDSLTNNIESILIYKYIASDSKNTAKPGKEFLKSDSINMFSISEFQNFKSAFLNDSNNYKNDSLILLSPYIPAFGMEIEGENNKLTLIVSFSNRTWRLLNGDSTIVDYNYANEYPLRKIYNSLK